jgi:hypothetical protein
VDEKILKLLSRPTISVAEAGIVLGVGKHALYDAIGRGEIETFPYKGQKRVLTAPLRQKLGIASDAAA